MSDAKAPRVPSYFTFKFYWRELGSAAPMFPGFDVDINDRISEDEKPDAMWHRERASSMLRAHPEINGLRGRSAWTAVCCVLAAGSQVALAMAVAGAPFWLLLLTAYFAGAIINIMLFQLAHECDHHLVFRRPSWNRYLFTLTSLPMFLSAHHTWWIEHLVHHVDMGAKKDFISRRRTFFLATRNVPPLFFPYALIMLVLQAIRSALGLVVYLFTSLLRGRLVPTDRALTILADEHLVSGYRSQRIARWAVVYPLLSFAMCGVLFWFGGWKPLVYLWLSQTFFTGFLHPYCLGWVLGISHFHGCRTYQPSASHYGKLVNLLSFNAGLHVEHHDIMGIPWFRLWKLRKIAPEFYDDLEQIRSYSLLGLRFVFSREKSFDANFNNEAHRYVEWMSDPQVDSSPASSA